MLVVGKIPGEEGQQPTPLFLPAESRGTVEPGGLQSTRGSQRVGHDGVTNIILNVIRALQSRENVFLVMGEFKGFLVHFI